MKFSGSGDTSRLGCHPPISHPEAPRPYLRRMKNTAVFRFLRARSPLGLLAVASLLIYSGLIFAGIFPEKDMSLLVIGPAMLGYFLVMGYSGCDIKGGMSATCQFWSPPVIAGSLFVEAICVYFVFELIERILIGPQRKIDL